MVFLLIGQQGTGKSTLGRALEERRNVKFVSGGVLIREEIASESELGCAIKGPIDAGNRIPPAKMYEMLASRVRKLDGAHLVLDGFPAAAEEQGELEAVVGSPSMVMLLEGVPTDQLVQRIEQRVECKVCYRTYNRDADRCCRQCGTELQQRPEDDDRQKIERRHRRWTKTAAELVSLYEGLGTLRRIDARISADQVLTSALSKIDFYKIPPS
jgi:adenylate kinase